MENDLLDAADNLCAEAQKRAGNMWDYGYYTEAIYLAKAYDAYLIARGKCKVKNTFKIPVLIS